MSNRLKLYKTHFLRDSKVMRSGSQRYAGASSNSNTILSSIIPSASSKLPTMIKSSFPSSLTACGLISYDQPQ
ncbi:hypothetical protein [Parabacteroides distasonis]|uniref:hypothetical protein n=1 Tax=Parabacteroides distasonis TaxID=823 RepID=UPI003F20A845